MQDMHNKYMYRHMVMVKHFLLFKSFCSFFKFSVKLFLDYFYFVLLNTIGDAKYNCIVSDDLIIDAFDYYDSL